MEKIRPVRRPSIGEMVCEQIKEYLLEGRWKPGDKVPPEKELARSFGVSRVTVRDALLRLAAQGFLESRFGGGSYVREITPGMNLHALLPVAYLGGGSVMEVMEYRQVVEARTAGLAARRSGPEDAAALEAIYAAMERHQNDPSRFAEEDLNYHFHLAAITGNSLLIETMNIIRSLLGRAMAYAVARRGCLDGLECHRRLTDAVTANDEAAAQRIMQAHIDSVCETTRSEMAGIGRLPAGQPIGGLVRIQN